MLEYCGSFIYPHLPGIVFQNCHTPRQPYRSSVKALAPDLSTQEIRSKLACQGKQGIGDVALCDTAGYIQRSIFRAASSGQHSGDGRVRANDLLLEAWWINKQLVLLENGGKLIQGLIGWEVKCAPVYRPISSSENSCRTPINAAR